MTSNDCPADLDDVAEAYIIGALPAEQVITLEAHYSDCARCRAAILGTAEYVDAMRAATKTLGSELERYEWPMHEAILN
jgi:hypothetical protein